MDSLSKIDELFEAKKRIMKAKYESICSNTNSYDFERDMEFEMQSFSHDLYQALLTDKKKPQ